jgi:hypothetical protein
MIVDHYGMVTVELGRTLNPKQHVLRHPTKSDCKVHLERMPLVTYRPNWVIEIQRGREVPRFKL